jgi:transposase
MANKKSTPNKTDDDIRLAVFNYYCDGKNISEACRIVGVSEKTAHNWKKQKWPEAWEPARERRTEAKKKLLEEESLESLAVSDRKRQKVFQEILNEATRRIKKDLRYAKTKTSVVADILFKSADAERKLYVPPEVAFRPTQNNLKVNAGAASFSKPNGESGVLATLNAMWEEHNGNPQSDNSDDSDPARDSDSGDFSEDPS